MPEQRSTKSSRRQLRVLSQSPRVKLCIYLQPATARAIPLLAYKFTYILSRGDAFEHRVSRAPQALQAAHRRDNI